MNPLQRIVEICADAEELNSEVQENIETITLMDARRLEAKIREAEGWLLGVRKVLLGLTPPPAS
jgi:hypothetical protein